MEPNVNTLTLDNNITWAMIIAGIALLTSIISPIITTIINNCHQTKLKKIEFSHSIKVKVYNEYIDITSREILISGISEEYKKIYAKIFLYAPNKLWSSIKLLNDMIINDKNSEKIFCDEEKCLKILIEISKELNKSI